MNARKEHIGGSFEDVLKAEGRYEEATAIAVKRVLAWQLPQAMAERRLGNLARPPEISQFLRRCFEACVHLLGGSLLCWKLF